MPRPEDEDYGGEPALPPVGSLTGMDGMFAKTNIVLLILFGLCCNGIALILGIVGLITCKDPRAKQNALIVTIIGAIITGLGVVAQVVGRLR
jgi:hypothetical protein